MRTIDPDLGRVERRVELRGYKPLHIFTIQRLEPSLNLRVYVCVCLCYVSAHV